MTHIKESRALSFTAVAAVYLLAAVLGVAVYLACPGHFAVRLLIADMIATAAVFIFSLIFGNASVYDPYWSVQPPVIVTAFALQYGVNLFGILLLAAIWFWAIRLTANWAYTFRSLTHQDWRYTMLREKTGILYPLINFIGIHTVPTLVVYLCTMPAVYATVHALPITPLSALFCLTAILAAVLQGISDIQMHRFRRQKSGGFIRAGLWKYCRHPNYLGEILMWWSVGLAVFASSGPWMLLIGAAANTLLFLFVSIPMADGRQSKKSGWDTYKRQTWALLPLYKKQ